MFNRYEMFFKDYMPFQYPLSTISGVVPPYLRLILDRFPGYLSIHYYQFECIQEAKTDEDYQPQSFH